jgi:hypothetical protein
MRDPDQDLGSLRLCRDDKGVSLEMWNFKRCIWSLGGNLAGQNLGHHGLQHGLHVNFFYSTTT